MSWWKTIIKWISDWQAKRAQAREVKRRQKEAEYRNRLRKDKP